MKKTSINGKNGNRVYRVERINPRGEWKIWCPELTPDPAKQSAMPIANNEKNDGTTKLFWDGARRVAARDLKKLDEWEPRSGVEWIQSSTRRADCVTLAWRAQGSKFFCLWGQGGRKHRSFAVGPSALINNHSSRNESRAWSERDPRWPLKRQWNIQIVDALRAECNRLMLA